MYDMEENIIRRIERLINSLEAGVINVETDNLLENKLEIDIKDFRKQYEKLIELLSETDIEISKIRKEKIDNRAKELMERVEKVIEIREGLSEPGSKLKPKPVLKQDLTYQERFRLNNVKRTNEAITRNRFNANESGFRYLHDTYYTGVGTEWDSVICIRNILGISKGDYRDLFRYRMAVRQRKC